MSSPLPYHVFYHKEWLASSAVRRMTLAGRGLYKDLLCFQWEDGYIPDDIAEIARMTSSTVKEIRDVWPRVRAQFEEFEPGKLRQGRMHVDREKASLIVARNAENGAKGGLAKAKRTVSENLATAKRTLSEDPDKSLSENVANPVDSKQYTVNTPLTPEGGIAGAEKLLPWWTDRTDSVAVLALRVAGVSLSGGERPYDASVLPETRLKELLDRVALIDPGKEFLSLLGAFAEYHHGKRKPPYKDPIRALGDWVTKREGEWASAKRARARTGAGLIAGETAEQKSERIKAELRAEREKVSA